MWDQRQLPAVCPKECQNQKLERQAVMTPTQRMGAMHGTEPKEDGLWSRVAEEQAALGSTAW